MAIKNSDNDDAIDARHAAENAEVEVLIERLQATGSDPKQIAYALIRCGLGHLRLKFCDEHVLEELEYLRDWIVQRIEIERAGGTQ